MLFLDEISTGLDSSTTYSIVKFLADTTHFLNYTTIIALLQPAPETYDLFDDILLLSSGAAHPSPFCRPCWHLTLRFMTTTCVQRCSMRLVNAVC